jgi:hypothetical protein
VQQLVKGKDWVPTLDDPGANLRLTATLTASAADAPSGVAEVVFQRAPAGGGTWTDLGTDTSAPYSVDFDTTAVADGVYDLRVRATDVAGNTGTAVVANRRVDNTPPSATMNDPGPNLRATVILATYGRVDALLTADAESPVTLPLNPPPVEILKVAHHGSADDGLPRLLDVTRPVVAVVSCGRDNAYGHPAPTTIAALAAEPGLDVFRTDRDGRVTIETDGTRIAAESQR